MDDQQALLEAFTALTGYFVSDASMPDTLTRVSDLARQTVSESVQVGITLVVEDKRGTYAFTNPELIEVDQAQYDTGEGPGLRAYYTGEVVLLKSTLTSPLYPQFCAVAAQHGIRSVVSFPLATAKGCIGAMNHYSTREHVFGPAEIELGRRFADQAAYLLVNAQAYWDARTLGENLTEAMKSRAAIEQAKGILIARTGVDEEAAFDLLKEQSQAENRKLRDVALEIVHLAKRRNRPSGYTGSTREPASARQPSSASMTEAR